MSMTLQNVYTTYFAKLEEAGSQMVILGGKSTIRFMFANGVLRIRANESLSSLADHKTDDLNRKTTDFNTVIPVNSE